MKSCPSNNHYTLEHVFLVFLFLHKAWGLETGFQSVGQASLELNIAQADLEFMVIFLA